MKKRGPKASKDKTFSKRFAPALDERQFRDQRLNGARPFSDYATAQLAILCMRFLWWREIQKTSPRAGLVRDLDEWAADQDDAPTERMINCLQKNQQVRRIHDLVDLREGEIAAWYRPGRAGPDAPRLLFARRS